MNQNARSTNRTDADSPMLSMVEFLQETDKEEGISHFSPRHFLFEHPFYSSKRGDQAAFMEIECLWLGLNSLYSTSSYS